MEENNNENILNESENINQNVNEEINNNKVIEENPKRFEITYMPKKKKSNSAKSFILGILGGLIGASIVLAIVLFISPVNNALFNNSEGNNNESNNSVLKYDIKEYDNPVIAISEVVGSSIVGIKVDFSYNSFFGQQKASQEGSGIIIKSDGYIVTNNHVIALEQYASDPVINVYLPNSDEPLQATVVGTDEQTDIAIIKVDCTDLPAAKLGNSSDLKVGEMVVAIGNPLGMDFAGSVTVGYVSALNRKLTDSNNNQYNLIQTDAAINSGNSGGALVNTKGEVIGINIAKIQGTGIEGLSFAIPIDDIKDIIATLEKGETVKRPYIGIGGTAVNKETAKKYNLVEGIYVSEVYTFSAAEKAGIKVGDVITKLEGQTVKTVNEMNAIKDKYKIGDKLKITINRNGKEMELELTLLEYAGESYIEN